MNWSFWHRFEWEKKVREVKIIRRVTLYGVPAGVPVEYVEHRQRGICTKCGYVKERRL